MSAGIHVPVALALSVAAPLTALASFGLLRLYRRAALRAARESAGTSTLPPLEPNLHPAGERPQLRLITVQPETPIVPSALGQSCYRFARRSLWQTAMVYALAGVVFQLVNSYAAWIAFEGRGGFELGRWFGSVAWPIALTIGLVAAATRTETLALIAAFAAITSGLFATDRLLSPGVALVPSATQVLVEAIGPMIFILPFLHRRIRAVGALMLPLVFLSVFGSFFSFFAVVSTLSQPEVRHNPALQAALGALYSGIGAVGVTILAHLIGAAVLFALGWQVARWTGRRFREKKLSAQSVILDALWLSLAIMYSVALSGAGLGYAVAPFFAFALYKASVWIAGSTLRSKPTALPGAPRLLVLRVFSLGVRSERLFHALSKRWLRLGEISLISGPDLITQTVRPDEFLEFLGGRLSRSFVRDRSDFERRVSMLDGEPDKDGGYRITEFFCYSDTWQTAVRGLVEHSDAILMDLRSFAPLNKGCLYELQVLLRLAPLERVVLLIDETTDIAYLSSTLQDIWRQAGNAAQDADIGAPTLRMYRMHKVSTTALATLMRLLSDAGSLAGKKV
jgi:hypothetical protein